MNVAAWVRASTSMSKGEPTRTVSQNFSLPGVPQGEERICTQIPHLVIHSTLSLFCVLRQLRQISALASVPGAGCSAASPSNAHRDTTQLLVHKLMIKHVYFTQLKNGNDLYTVLIKPNFLMFLQSLVLIAEESIIYLLKQSSCSWHRVAPDERLIFAHL